MSNLVSLDDIIKKSKTSTMRNRGPQRKPAAKIGVKANGAAPKRIRTAPIEDARFKIIQKKRKTITDARDKLAQIAKQSDARLKLQKLRASNPKKIESSSASRKTGTGRNGRLPSSKPMPTRVHSMPAPYIPPPRTMSYRPPPMPETHYVNDMIRNYGNEYLMDHHQHHHQAALRRTVSNEYTPTLPPPPPLFNIKPVPYDWDKPSHHTSSSLSRNQPMRSSDHSSRPRDYKVIPTRSPVSKIDSSPYKNDWSFNSKSRTIIPQSSMESKYYGVRNHRDIGVKSRLDSPPLKSSRSVASSSRPKSSSSQSGGYRIVVSNLQPNVTQEDIKELFEDVGELLISRLVRAGIAEVIYKTYKDASKAVETYHNRQLDGHPMKCLLVNSGPKSSSTSSGRVISQSRSSSNYSSQRNLGTVYHALFD